jgi:putative salt-induced outer membrane protein YdiY
MKGRQAAVLASALMACLPLSGAVVELTNGDHITGKIVSKDDISIKVKTEMMGEVKILMFNVAKIDENAGSPPTKPAKPKSDVASKASSGGKAPLNPAVVFSKVGLDHENRRYLYSEAREFFRRVNLLNRWNSNLKLAYSLASSTTEAHSNSVEFSTERKLSINEYRFTFMQEYATTTNEQGVDTVTSDKLRATGRYRYNLSSWRFLQSESEYGFNHISGIDQDYMESLGYGMRIVQNKHWYFSVIPSGTTQYQVLRTARHVTSYGPSISAEAEYRWSDSLRIRDETTVYFPVTSDNKPSYHLSFILENKLVGNVSLNLEYTYDYDGAVSNSSQVAQTCLKAALGIDF